MAAYDADTPRMRPRGGVCAIACSRNSFAALRRPGFLHWPPPDLAPACRGTGYRKPKRQTAGATLSYGLFRPFSKPPSNVFNPVLGILGATVEGYGSVGELGDAGVRAFLTSQMFATSVGRTGTFAIRTSTPL
jgi:hypothetical protein